MKQKIPVCEPPLGTISRHEEYAWLCTAVLAKLDLGIGLADRSQELLVEIRKTESAQAEFKALVPRLEKPDDLGISELQGDEGRRVLRFVFETSEC